MKPPDRPPDRVVYGEPEPLRVTYMTWEDRPTIAQALFGGHNWVSVSRERWGRRCHEFWDTEPYEIQETDDGLLVQHRPVQTIGRWYWIPEPRYQPHGSPPLPVTSARDQLEDEMGYEQAVRYIGHRELSMGMPMDLGLPDLSRQAAS